LVFVCGSAGAKEKPARPKILGIAAAHFYSTDVPAARKFYELILHPAEPCSWCKQTGTAPILITLPSGQKVTFTPAPAPAPKDLLWEVTLATDNVKAMKEYLKANVAIEKSVKGDGSAFTIKDSEGHRLGFVQVAAGWSPSNTGALRLMHAGFIFNDRSGADHFYKDILGFHLYWQGGNPDTRIDWVMMQVPNGTDWIEYMLYLPEHPTLAQLGGANHLAPGATDVSDYAYDTSGEPGHHPENCPLLPFAPLALYRAGGGAAPAGSRRVRRRRR